MNRFFLTIDVEEWYRAENIRSYVTPNQKKSHSSALALDSILDLCEKTNSRTTLFVVSEDIHNYRNQLERAVNMGCELASHTHNHSLLTHLTLKETKEQLRISKHRIEDTFSKRVVGFRSPCFSQNQYLEEALIENEYLYTSNGIQASFHDRYGQRPSIQDAIPDFQLPSASFLQLKYPTTGGGWFRLFPLSAQMKAIQTTNDDIVFYCHPWDFDTQQPIPGNAPLFNKFRHTVGSSRSLSKLEKLLTKFGSQNTLKERYNELYG